MSKEALLSSRKVPFASIDVTPELLLDLLRIPPEGIRIGSYILMEDQDEDGIPEDAKALRCGLTENGNIRLLLESCSFASIPEGCPIPQLTPSYYKKEPVDIGADKL